MFKLYYNNKNKAFELLTSCLNMKRSVKSTRTKSKNENLSDNEIENLKYKPMSTRSRMLKDEDSVAEGEEDEAPQKIDLSKFKLQSKEVANTFKREHIQVQYDTSEDSSVSDAKVAKKANPELSKKMPENWEEVLKNLRKMRETHDAPVDTMGCDQCPDENATPEDKRFQALLSLMLSSQTKDQVTHAAMLRLIKHGCSLTNILNTSDEKLGELIYPVCFWKTKTKNIKKTAEMIREVFNSDIPKTAEDLCKLPGVGPKMAHLCMKTAWDQITGIGVDTHVHRITNRLGWVTSKTPEDTRKILEGWLPRDLWSEVNHILVGFGQQICKPVKPQCKNCLNNQLCPFGIKELRGGNKRK